MTWFSRTNRPEVSAPREHSTTERQEGGGGTAGWRERVCLCVCSSLFSVVPVRVPNMQMWFEPTPGDVLSLPVHLLLLGLPVCVCSRFLHVAGSWL